MFIRIRSLIAGVVLVMFIAPFAEAQKIKLRSGSLKPLKEEKSFNIKFHYDSMAIGGDRLAEKPYLSKKREDWETKEEGKGSAFVAMWFEDRKQLYEPAFIRTFEEYGEVKLNDQQARYTIVLKTKRTEGGWSIGVLSHPGEIDGELWVVESANPEKVIARVIFLNIFGKYISTDDFDMTKRIESAYARAGHGLADFVKRKSR